MYDDDDKLNECLPLYMSKTETFQNLLQAVSLQLHKSIDDVDIMFEDRWMSKNDTRSLEQLGFGKSRDLDRLRVIDRRLHDFALRIALAASLHHHLQEQSVVQPIVETERLPIAASTEVGDKLGTCSICMNRPVSGCFHPCGHTATCQTCSVSLTRCPICRSPAKFIKLFLNACTRQT